MAAGLSDHVWELDELIALMPKPVAKPWGSVKRTTPSRCPSPAYYGTRDRRLAFEGPSALGGSVEGGEHAKAHKTRTQYVVPPISLLVVPASAPGATHVPTSACYREPVSAGSIPLLLGLQPAPFPLG
jgi:hypothetical protein